MLDWWLPENVSTYGQDIDWLFHLIYYITGVTFILVTVTMLAFLVIYRDRPGRRARYTHGSTPLEIAWTVVPALILVVLTFLSGNMTHFLILASAGLALMVLIHFPSRATLEDALAKLG